jgi:hypothetical protein
LVIQSEAGNHDRFARANRKPSIIPAGPPPTTQHFVVIGESVIWINRSVNACLVAGGAKDQSGHAR